MTVRRARGPSDASQLDRHVYLVACAGTGDPETVSFLPQTARYIGVVDTVLLDGLSTTTTTDSWSIDELNLYA